MKRVICAALAVAGLLSLAPVVEAQDSKKDAPKTLDELLRDVRGARTRERQQNASREAEFRRAKEKQQELLDDAREQRAAAEARSEELEATFELNENEIPELEETLRNRLGHLLLEREPEFLEFLDRRQFLAFGEFVQIVGAPGQLSAHDRSIEETPGVASHLPDGAAHSPVSAR